MIEKIDKEKISSYIVGTPTALENITNKINEIIECLNNKEKTYISAKTNATIKMTNAEKYLKDENYKKILWYDFKNWYSKTKCNCPYGIAFAEFMEQQIKPSLTEDEKVILKNIDKIFEYIGRTKNGTLFLRVEMFGKTDDRAFHFFNHLFQFIKERRRI